MFVVTKASGCLCAALFMTGLGHAQAVPAADQRIRLGVYALGSYVRPGYNDAAAGAGLAIGTNLDGIRVLPFLDLGLDLRGVATRANVLNQLSFAAGPRLSYNRYRFQPYAEYMFGIGRGNFNNATDPNYTHDITAIRSYGGGFDLRTTRSFSFRADVQYQRWRFTYRQPYFHPVEASVGVLYHLHGRSRNGPRY